MVVMVTDRVVVDRVMPRVVMARGVMPRMRSGRTGRQGQGDGRGEGQGSEFHGVSPRNSARITGPGVA